MFKTWLETKTEHVSGKVTGNIPSSYKVNTGKNTVIKDVEDDINELPGSIFYKSAALLFDKIDIGKAGVLPLSKFVDFIETIVEGFHGE